LASNGWISRFKRRHNTAYRNLSRESWSVDSETVEDWKNYRLLQETEGNDLCDINNSDETSPFLGLQTRKPSILKDTSVMVVDNLNSGLLCSSHAIKAVVIKQSLQ
jgi:hypothetical protein